MIRRNLTGCEPFWSPENIFALTVYNQLMLPSIKYVRKIFDNRPPNLNPFLPRLEAVNSFQIVASSSVTSTLDASQVWTLLCPPHPTPNLNRPYLPPPLSNVHPSITSLQPWPRVPSASPPPLQSPHRCLARGACAAAAAAVSHNGRKEGRKTTERKVIWRLL